MLLLFLVTICAEIVSIYGDCEYRSYLHGSITVLHPIDDDFTISTKTEHKRLINGQKITVFCEADFEPMTSFYDPSARVSHGQLITLECENNCLYYSTGKIIKQRMTQMPQFNCPQSSALLYSANLKDCKYKGLVYAIRVASIPIVFAEICYNYNTSDVMFVHYVAAKRSALLKSQIVYNPSKINMTTLESGSKVAATDQTPLPVVLGSKYTHFSPFSKHLLDEVTYCFYELVPKSAYSGNFKQYQYKIGSLVNVLWWTSLHNGNWKIFQNLLNKESLKRPLEIYVGHSHTSKYPENFTCNSGDDMTFTHEGEEKTVPLYIWNYIRPFGNDTTAEPSEIVIIGINSPFVPAGRKDIMEVLEICDDICDKIEWLEPLESTRNIPTFGYIFCCNPENVKDVLKGFPQIT